MTNNIGYKLAVNSSYGMLSTINEHIRTLHYIRIGIVLDILSEQKISNKNNSKIAELMVKKIKTEYKIKNHRELFPEEYI